MTHLLLKIRKGRDSHWKRYVVDSHFSDDLVHIDTDRRRSCLVLHVARDNRHGDIWGTNWKLGRRHFLHLAPTGLPNLLVDFQVTEVGHNSSLVILLPYLGILCRDQLATYFL